MVRRACFGHGRDPAQGGKQHLECGPGTRLRALGSRNRSASGSSNCRWRPAAQHAWRLSPSWRRKMARRKPEGTRGAVDLRWTTASPLLRVQYRRDKGLVGPPLHLGPFQVPIDPVHPPRGPRGGVGRDGEHVLLAPPVQLPLVEAVDGREVGVGDDAVRRLRVLLDATLHELGPRRAHAIEMHHHLAREVAQVFLHHRLHSAGVPK